MCQASTNATMSEKQKGGTKPHSGTKKVGTGKQKCPIFEAAGRTPLTFYEYDSNPEQ
jgi:hypothetical protein